MAAIRDHYQGLYTEMNRDQRTHIHHTDNRSVEGDDHLPIYQLVKHLLVPREQTAPDRIPAIVAIASVT